MKPTCRHSVIQLGALLVPLVMTLTPSTALAGPMTILAPSYYGTASADPTAWSNLESYWQADYTAGNVIINEASGPGPAYDDTLASSMDDLVIDSGYGANILVYVDLPESHDANKNPIYGFDPVEKTGEIDNWYNWYNSQMIAGVFFDDVARENSGSQAFDLAHIEYVVSYLANSYNQYFPPPPNPPIIVLNAAGPYTTTAETYYCVGQIAASVGARLILVTMETYEDRTRSNSTSDIITHGADFAAGGPLNWVYGYPATTFAGLIHDGTAAAVMSDLQTLANYNMANTFVTDQLESNTPPFNAWYPGPSADVWANLTNDSGSKETGSPMSWTFPGGSGGTLSFNCPPASSN
jgi:hypothetical protein